MALNSYIQSMISGMIGRCAVPLFYIISGYLFFYKVPNGMRSIVEKMKKRVRTLLVPYIIAAVFFVAFGVLVAIIPGTSQFMNSTVLPLFEKDWITILISIFYDAGNGSPMAFQLWFLRNLILLVLFSPIWYLAFKYLKWGWLVILFVSNYLSLHYFPVYALFWFSLGGALIKVNMTKEQPKLGIVSLIIFLCLCFIQLFYPDSGLWTHLKIPVVFLGVTAIWFMYAVLVPQSFSLSSHKWLAKVCSFTFFIYLFHEPTLNIVRKLVVFALGKNETGYLVSYLVSPWIFIVLAIMIGIIFNRYIPKIYGIAVGGR
jgi:peptidoglycan/LPS O-acetylase OafA/YrhL